MQPPLQPSDDREYIRRSAEYSIKSREFLYRELKKFDNIKGLQVICKLPPPLTYGILVKRASELAGGTP